IPAAIVGPDGGFHPRDRSLCRANPIRWTAHLFAAALGGRSLAHRRPRVFPALRLRRGLAAAFGVLIRPAGGRTRSRRAVRRAAVSLLGTVAVTTTLAAARLRERRGGEQGDRGRACKEHAH